MWLLIWFGTICLCKVSHIILVPLRRIVLLRKWSVILVFYCFAFCCVILVCVCLYFVFIIIFVADVFKRPPGVDSPYVCRLIVVLDLEIHCMCSVLKRRGDYVKTLYSRCFSMEYTWSVCRDLAGVYFSTYAFWKLWLFFDATN